MLNDGHVDDVKKFNPRRHNAVLVPAAFNQQFNNRLTVGALPLGSGLFSAATGRQGARPDTHHNGPIALREYQQEVLCRRAQPPPKSDGIIHHVVARKARQQGIAGFGSNLKKPTALVRLNRHEGLPLTQRQAD